MSRDDAPSASSSPSTPFSASPSSAASAAPAAEPAPSGPGAATDPLARLGWDGERAAAFVPFARRGLLPGRVVRVDRGMCDVATAAGTVRAHTGPVLTADPARGVCTGDWAAVDAGGDPRRVRALLPRRTALLRAVAGGRSEGQVLAANVDHVLVAVSLAAEFDAARLERFVALGWAAGALPLVVLTKADLLPGPADVAHLAADAAAAAPGAPVLAVSAATGTGLAELAARIAGGTCVLLGPSGAGKSTLANALLGRPAQEVRKVRETDGKGRHTTTTRDLLPLPETAGGGVLIDTPGLRGVGMWDAGDGLGRTFAEIEELARGCRFGDCGHLAEPGCAVLAALADGTLPSRRLESYRKLLRENARLAARGDARLRAEQKRIVRERSALGRHMRDRKRGGR